MKKLLLLALSALTCSSFAGWYQPWTSPLPAWQSTTLYSVPGGTACFDDFEIVNTSPTPITAINWWGTVSGPDQLKRPFYIAIYKDLGGLPNFGYFVWFDSIKVKSVVFQGIDANGKKIYKFYGDIKPGLSLPPEHLWIQISEDDPYSSNPGQPDFWWSAHQPTQLYNAVQYDYFAGTFSTLLDPFNLEKDDLAFEIY